MWLIEKKGHILWPSLALIKLNRIINCSRMSKEMLKFVNIGKETPFKRKVTNRKEDFKEIYSEFIGKNSETPWINESNKISNKSDII